VLTQIDFLILTAIKQSLTCPRTVAFKSIFI
jgi:hypothetical protein